MSVAELVPTEVRIRASSIPMYKTNRVATTLQGCTQVNQIFLKANCKISCSCMRYYHTLEDAKDVNVAEWYNGHIMTYIRDSFKEGFEPFSFCAGCVSHVAVMNVDEAAKKVGLHIEPSSQCNLFCSACTCTTERRALNPPARSNLDFDVFKKMIEDLAASDVEVSGVAFVGFGEPLFNSRLPDMARLSRQAFPKAWSYVDTNCNFGSKRAAEIANCGLSEIRMALDGVDQAPYEKYRESGDFKKAYAFAANLAKEVRDSGSKTALLWKYILFRHNDTDAEILKAVEMAEDIGVPITFDAAFGDLASSRSFKDIRALVGNRASTSSNLDPVAMEGGDDRNIQTPPPTVLTKAKRFLRRLRD